MNINITPEFLPTLTALATENGLTPEQYASNIVNSFLDGQYRAVAFEKLKKAEVVDIEKIKDVAVKDLEVKKLKDIVK